MRFVGVAFGVLFPLEGDRDEDPVEAPVPVPEALQSEDYPVAIFNEYWAGFMVEAFPKRAADRLRCSEHWYEAGLTVETLPDDSLNERAETSREAWDLYRAHCREMGRSDPGEGSLIIVAGVVAKAGGV